MEPGFTPKTLQYLSCLLWDSQSLEKTMDIIVPDTSPDVLRILSASAVPVMRTKECRTDGVTVTGGIRASVLYLAEGETSPRSLETYLPFDLHRDAAGLTEQASLLFSCSVKSADARLVNSRKVMVRVNLACLMRAYEKQEQTLYQLSERPEALQIHETQYPMVLPAEAAERSFQITEQLHFPASRPLTGDVFQFCPRMEITEKRLAGNKAVFKGLVHLSILYAATDGLPALFETEIPFSQYCEMQDIYEDEELDIVLTLTGCQPDRTTDGDGEGLFVTLHLLAQCLVSCRKDITFLDDAYAVEQNFVPKWQNHSFSARLDAASFSHSMRESLSAAASDVICCRVYADQPVITRRETSAELTVPVTAQILYYDRDDSLQCAVHRWEEKESIALAENAHCRASAILMGEVTAMAAGDTVELRCPMEIFAETVADCQYRSLCGCEISPVEGKSPRRPAVIARRTRTGERLWDIAKANGTTVDRIRSANHLNQDVTEAGILLIPT